MTAEVLLIDPPRPIAPPVDQGVVLPFVVDDPRVIDPAVRIAPALSQALIKCREADLTPERVMHVMPSESLPRFSGHRPPLPAEMPAHWLFSYIPELWEWACARRHDLHARYQQIQAVGFKSEVHRMQHYQSITLGAALELASAHSGPLTQMSERELEQGLAKLRDAIEEQGAESVIGSEVTLIEM